jgi:hypothetical protein
MMISELKLAAISKLAQSSLSNINRDYCTEIKKFKQHNKIIPTVIDVAHNQADIVNVFASSYKSLFSALLLSTENLDNIPSCWYLILSMIAEVNGINLFEDLSGKVVSCIVE